VKRGSSILFAEKERGGKTKKVLTAFLNTYKEEKREEGRAC